MDVEITLDGLDRLDELQSLEEWLLEDPGLAGCPVSRPTAAPVPGQMGVLSDILIVALGSGGVGAALASSLSVWLRTRVSDLTVRIRTHQGEVELEARNVKDPEAVIEAISQVVSSNGTHPA